MVSNQPMKKNTACRTVFPILDADGDPTGGAAGLDSEYSLDGGVFTDCTNEATNMTSGGSNTGVYYLDLVAGETNGDVVCIQVKTSTSGAKTTVLVFYTATQTLDETDVVADAIKAKTDLIGASVALETGGNLATIAGKLPTNKIMGSSVVTDKDDEIDAIKAKTDLIGTSVALEAGGNLAAVKAKTDNLPTDPADDSDIDAQLATIDGVVDAIKLKTDNLPADPADESNLTTLITAVDTVVDAIKLKTDNLPADPADASVIDADLMSIESKIDVIGGYLDTEIAAILADTNELQTDWADGGRLDLLLDSAISKIDAVDDYVDTEITAIKAVTDTLSLAAIADAVHDETTETGITLRKAMNIILAVLAGKSSGGGTATIKFRDQNDAKDRVNATVDADGNRTAITNDGA